jgi:hypothetical protein
MSAFVQQAGNGRDDLVVANFNSNSVSILRNAGSGASGPRMEYLTGIEPLCVPIGDLHGDGRPDAAAVGFFGYGVTTLRNQSSGPPCGADFKHDGFANFFDFDDFFAAFEQGC